MHNVLYHNPRCSKSREALRLLQDKGQLFEVRDYLGKPPSQEEIRQLCEALSCRPYDLVRQKDLVPDVVYPLPDDQRGWIHVLMENPRLLERPIVGIQGRWVIARPPEKVLELL